MWVERALHHRHVRVVLPQRAADVERRVVAADHDALLAGVGVRARGAPTSGAGRPRNTSMPGNVGRLGLPDMPVASTSCFGRRVSGWPSRSTSTVHSPGLLGVRRGGRRRARPVGHLHHLHVGLEPVGDLVLRREHRPVLGELEVGQVVVPDRVVQAQRLVAVAPLVAGPRVLVDHQRRYAELAQPRSRARCRPGRRRPRARRAASCCRGARPPAGASPPRSAARLLAPCSAPIGRCSLRGSSCPFSS